MNVDHAVASRRGIASDQQSRSVTAIARVARALVGAGGLHELGADALGAIGEALNLDVVAMYMPDPTGAHVLRLFKLWPEDSEPVQVDEVFALEPETWRFLASSVGPLVLRHSEAPILDNPFRRPADSWVAIPLVAADLIEGAVFGSSSTPIALEPVARSTLGSIADLLSAGVATARLRLEAQHTEMQRERLALVAELHDGLAQDLALAVREVTFLEADPPRAAAQASTARLAAAVRAAHRLVRAELEDLAANVSEPGLEIAAQAVVDRFAARGLRVRLQFGVIRPVPTAAVVAVLVRVLNEALANVERHARVVDAIVTIDLNRDTLVMCVADHGVGVDVDVIPTLGEGHFGISIMRIRAMTIGGSLEISSQPGAGTTIEVRVPMAGVPG